MVYGGLCSLLWDAENNLWSIRWTPRMHRVLEKGGGITILSDNQRRGARRIGGSSAVEPLEVSVSSYRGIPSHHHPFWMGIFPNINQTIQLLGGYHP